MLGRSQDLKKLALQLSVFAALAFPAGTPAYAQPADVYGGSGGRYFEFSCGPGQVLVGLRASAGVLIDNAQAICARVDSAGGFTGAAPQGPIFGNNRPQDQHVECPQGFAVATANIGKNENYPHVGAIQLRCTELANRAEGGTAHVEIRGSGNLEGHEVTIGVGGNPGGSMPGYSVCANGYAVGIRGRAEQHLTAFGLLCGQAVAVAEPGTPRTLGKRKKSSIAGKYPEASSTTSSIPQTQRTLGKRKRPGTWGTPAPEQPTGGAGASLDSDGSVGAYTKGPGWTGAAPAGASASAAAPSAPAPPSASSLIGGMYSTVLAIEPTVCLFQQLSGSSQQMLDLTPRPGIMVPLPAYHDVFGGPVTLNVEGLHLSQSTDILMKIGPSTTPVPAHFEGEFSEDGSRFEVEFKAGNALCRVEGKISGSRN